jgi:energy-converting hydrogenase A subunit H
MLEGIGGEILGVIRFGDIVPYITPFTLSMFILALTLTVLLALAKPENQILMVFGKDKYSLIKPTIEEMKFRRFMVIVCGLALSGAMITGDLFNFTLFVTLVGITNIGIIAAVRRPYVLEAAFQYGLICTLASLPLFGAAAIVLGTAGTLSLHELETLSVLPMAKILLAFGVAGETGIAPFYAAKAEVFRAPGAPYILMVHLSAIMVVIRTAEILLLL